MNIESFSTIALSGNMAASVNTAASANTSYSFKINMPSKDTSLCNFKPCFVIPVYNHGAALASVVQNLCYCGIPMILVDDGKSTLIGQLLYRAKLLFAGQKLFRIYRKLRGLFGKKDEIISSKND